MAERGAPGMLLDGMSGADPVSNCLELDAQAGVVRLTLNRPERRNALSFELLERLHEAIGNVAADRTARVMVLAAHGPVFSSGHDLAELTGLGESRQRELFELCARVMLGFRRMPQPVIARVQGLATAAGCQLVASCDFAVAAEGASFATPGVKIGLFCTTPMVPLMRVIPPRVALEMLMTAEPISAQRALQVGLVNRVVPADDLDRAVRAMCDSLVAQSPRVLAQGKRAFYDLEALSEPEAYQRATELMTACVRSEDAKEGIGAFLEKRPPRWDAAGS